MGPAEKIDELPSALETLAALEGRIEGRELALFLDYDGTLTPIVSRPEEAVLSERMRGILAELARLATVAVVSGRGLSDVRALVGIEELFYAGSHGFEIAGPGGLAMEHEEAKSRLPDLDAAENELSRSVLGIEGAILERKRFSLAVHYRNVAEEAVAGLEAAVDRTLERHPRLRKTHGKKVFDLRPDVAWDKGKALRWILDRLPRGSGSVLPVYIGDDLTDEDAFEAISKRGVPIVVGRGERRTAARYRVDDPAGVGRLLEALARLVTKKSGAV